MGCQPEGLGFLDVWKLKLAHGVIAACRSVRDCDGRDYNAKVTGLGSITGNPHVTHHVRRVDGNNTKYPFQFNGENTGRLKI